MTYRQRKQRHGRGRGGTAKAAAILIGVIVSIAVIAALSLAGYVLAIASGAPDLSELKPENKGEVSQIFAADGSSLGYVQSDEIRTPVPWSEMTRDVREAVIAIEDERFYEHKGVDYSAIIRAGIKNLESGKSLQGGSTITQQLVRALYIKDPERNFKRKIREAKLASELEKKRSKTWILKNYLDDVPFGTVGGRTAIGIEAAAETFFDKHARQLTLAESALLAGLPQAPSEYNPFHNPSSALRRRKEVLDKMAENNFISETEAALADQESLGLKKGTRYTRRREPYFFDYVQDKLIEEYGVGVYRRGGLEVHTTIDPKMQDLARTAINNRYGDPAGPGSAIVSVDPANGKIRAMASSGTYSDRTFNLAAQGHRQPGSAFKTMVLTAAVRKGIDPDSTSYLSAPFSANLEGFGPWSVKTFGNSYSGTISLTRATLSSDNSVYARLILDLGPKKVCETAKLLGIKTKLDCYPAEGLGGLTRGVTPLEMAGAYATLASGGVRHDPTGIERVVFPDGKVDDRADDTEGKRVLTDGQAYEVTKILEQNVQAGTGRAAIIGCPAAGKTGTTDQATDAWFVGYTPKLSTAVWVGHPDSRVEMPGAQGGTFAAPVWHDFMIEAKGDYCDGFPEPETPTSLEAYAGKSSSSGASSGSGTSTDSGSDYTESYDDGSGYSSPSTPTPDVPSEDYGASPPPAVPEPGYDPRVYEAPPQPPPPDPVPPAPVRPSPREPDPVGNPGGDSPVIDDGP